MIASHILGWACLALRTPGFEALNPAIFNPRLLELECSVSDYLALRLSSLHLLIP